VLLTVWLFGCLLLEEAVLVKFDENVLRNGLVLRCGCPPKYIEADVEPLVDLFVNLVIFDAKCLRGDSFFKSFCLGRGTIFISPTDIESWPASSLVVSRLVSEGSAKVSISLPGEDICAQNTSDDITKVRNIINVG
jgi:hypothetical protein